MDPGDAVNSPPGGDLTGSAAQRSSTRTTPLILGCNGSVRKSGLSYHDSSTSYAKGNGEVTVANANQAEHGRCGCAG